MKLLGDIAAGATIKFDFNTVDPETRVPFTLAGTPTVGVWKDGVKMTLDAAPTLHVDKQDADGTGTVTGLNWVVLDTTADADYAAGSDYVVKLTAGTVNGYSVAGQTIATFSLENRETVLRDGSLDADKFASGLLLTEIDLVKSFGVTLVVDGVAATPTTTTFTVDSAELLTNTQIDNALILHLSTGRYSRITDITGTAVTVSPAFPAAPSDNDEMVVFGQYLASL